MDPDETWARILLLSGRIVDTRREEYEPEAEELAELILDLSDWVANGGFPPKAWTK